MEKEIIKNKIQKLVNQYNARNFQHVIQGAQILLKKLPNNIYLINLIGSCHQSLGNLKIAADAFIYIIGMDKKNIAAYNNLGNVFKTQKKYNEAKEQYQKAIEIDPNFVNAIVNLGNLHFEINDFETAIKHLTKAIQIDDKNILAHYNLGLVLQSIGDFENSNKEFERVLEIDPTITNADKLISRSTKYTKNHSHIKKMEEKLNKIELNDAQKSNLYFSLGKAYEDFEDYQKSFEYIKLANNTKRKLINLNLKNDFESFKKLKEFFINFKLEKNSANLKRKKIIFIVGLPRSGTSLIEQIISTHSDVYGGGELDYINRIVRHNFYNNEKLDISKLENLNKKNSEVIANSYLDLIQKFDSNSKIFTDKAPLNCIWIGIIKILFPNSKIVLCSRNPKDNILSLYKNDFDDRLDFTYDFNDLFDFYKEYSDLMKFWKDIFKDEIYDANYEQIIKNPENEIKNLLKFCDLKFEKECLAFHKNKRPIKTVSSAQARKPIYNSSMSSHQKYEEYMKDIFQRIDSLK